MGGWAPAWPQKLGKLQSELKKLGYSDSDIQGLIKSTSTAELAKHVEEMKKKNAAKGAAFDKLLKDGGVKT